MSLAELIKTSRCMLTMVDQLNEWSFGRGPTTPGIGDLPTVVINHLLNGMILQLLFV